MAATKTLVLWLTILLFSVATASCSSNPPQKLSEPVAPPQAPAKQPTISNTADTPQSGFSVKFRNVVTPYPVTAMFVSPGETVDIEVLMGSETANYRLTNSSGTLKPTSAGRWRWTAPKSSGLTPLTIVDPVSGQTSVLNVFVLVPMNQIKNEKLKGYRIGSYPNTSQIRRKKHYQLPKGFVEVTRANRDVLLSPHFTLGQFLCKQADGWPKFIVIKTELLLKLELILEQANDRWGGISTFTVMSGYRTPWYNRAIGNVPFSRHVFGDAVDIFVDRDNNGVMDDLNGDGKSDYADAVLLGSLVENMTTDVAYKPFVGGLGQYGARPHRGPFIHVDLRGFRARWNKP